LAFYLVSFKTELKGL